MISAIRGTLIESGPTRAVIQVGGLEYEVNIPVTTAERLPRAGGEARLHTYVAYREDAQTLYGFASPDERDFFRLMIENVTGIGPKMAMSIMSRMSLPLLRGAIRSGDTATLAKCPGIGKKTAERLVVELKGRLQGGQDAAAAHAPAGEHGDAVAALIALGYRPADADESVRRASLALGPGAATEALVKKALA
ncbi:MAG TPA: Holliday junction branch migration protein RuvA [Opitutaceae bacterium]|jgi:Holliday junction DNA helicase RuvA